MRISELGEDLRRRIQDSLDKGSLEVTLPVAAALELLEQVDTAANLPKAHLLYTLVDVIEGYEDWYARINLYPPAFNEEEYPTPPFDWKDIRRLRQVVKKAYGKMET